MPITARTTIRDNKTVIFTIAKLIEDRVLKLKEVYFYEFEGKDLENVELSTSNKNYMHVYACIRSYIYIHAWHIIKTQFDIKERELRRKR